MYHVKSCVCVYTVYCTCAHTFTKFVLLIVNLMGTCSPTNLFIYTLPSKCGVCAHTGRYSTTFINVA